MTSTLLDISISSLDIQFFHQLDIIQYWMLPNTAFFKPRFEPFNRGSEPRFTFSGSVPVRVPGLLEKDRLASGSNRLNRLTAVRTVLEPYTHVCTVT
jgi:hypothetical protein